MIRLLRQIVYDPSGPFRAWPVSHQSVFITLQPAGHIRLDLFRRPDPVPNTDFGNFALHAGSIPPDRSADIKAHSVRSIVFGVTAAVLFMTIMIES